MHGPSDLSVHNDARSMLGSVRGLILRHKAFCLLVLAPTILIAAYCYLIAANQYESEAHFVVRTSDTSSASASGFGQALSLVGVSTSQSDTEIVSDYLTSHDAVDALQKRIGLSARFSRPEADIFSRLIPADPTPERLLEYYLSKVTVKNHNDTGVATLQVRTFRPQDSLAIMNALLQLSEERVNQMNQRSYRSAVALAEKQLAAAEANVADVQHNMTGFRRNQGDFNPEVTGTARVSLVSQLEARLAEARAQMDATASAVSPSAPQLVALRQRVAALSSQVAAEKAKISQGPGNVATGLGQFEGLHLQQEFASKRYEAAALNLQKAQEEAAKQQLFLVRVVNPNLPVKSLYPKRTRTVLTIFIGLLLLYGIGWLIAAGVKEHAAA